MEMFLVLMTGEIFLLLALAYLVYFTLHHISVCAFVYLAASAASTLWTQSSPVGNR